MNNSRGTLHSLNLKGIKKSNNDEFKHLQIYKNLLIEFRKCENDVKNRLEEAKKDKDAATARQNVGVVQQTENKEADQKDIIKFRYLLRKKEYELSFSDRQFIEYILDKHPNLALKKDTNRGFYSVNMYRMEKQDYKTVQTTESNQEENIVTESNEKENIFEIIVKDFRVKYDKEYKKQIEKNNELLPFQEQNKIQSEYFDKSYWEILQACYRVLGTEYMKRNDVKESLKFFQAFKVLCDKNKTFTLKMLAYKEIGFCYKLVKQYRSALINFKKLLQLAWYRGHKGWELKAYDYIGIAYYYLGELEKSKYYHKRMWEGIYESENSAVRIIAINALRQKMENRILSDDRGVPQIKLDASYVINQSDEDENDLPSPRTGSGEGDLKLLPFFIQKKSENKFKLPYLNTNAHARQASRKNTMMKSLSNRVHPFMLISHLSPNESPNNYFYVEQMGSFRVRGEMQKYH